MILDEDRAARAAAGLVRALDAAPGDVIAVLAGNGEAAVAARDAATAADLVLAPINPRLAPAEIDWILGELRPRALLTDRAHARPGAIVIEDVPPAATDLKDLYRDRTGATILLTSGTTGRPKACLRTAGQDHARALELRRTYSLREDDVHLIACPLAHSAPGIFLRACRGAGARTVILPRFDVDGFLDAVEAHRASVFFLVPTQWHRLLERRDRSVDWSSVRAAIVAGAPITPDTKARIADWLGPGKLWEFYGSSETGTVTVIGPDQHAAHPGSVGRAPAGVSLRIRDGEVFVRSAAVMAGYRQPDGSLVRPDEDDGHISVGDLGRLDGEWLTLVDRKHDTIVTGGMNVYPAEVERALAEHPDVRGAVVFGVDDPEWGQRVAAVIATATPDDELIGFLRDRLAGYKIPRAIARCTIDELPIGSSGKPLRRAARALFIARRDS